MYTGKPICITSPRPAKTQKQLSFSSRLVLIQTERTKVEAPRLITSHPVVSKRKSQKYCRSTEEFVRASQAFQCSKGGTSEDWIDVWRMGLDQIDFHRVLSRFLQNWIATRPRLI